MFAVISYHFYKLGEEQMLKSLKIYGDISPKTFTKVQKDVQQAELQDSSRKFFQFSQSNSTSKISRTISFKDLDIEYDKEDMLDNNIRFTVNEHQSRLFARIRLMS